MKIVSYNLWNVEKNIDRRLELLCSTLDEVMPDTAGFQEVRSLEDVEYIKGKCGYEYSIWRKYYDCEEGLAILSKHPIIHCETNWEDNSETHNSFAIRTIIQYNDMKIGLTNLHLDYESPLNREIEIVNTVKMIEKRAECDYEIMLGDFNDHPNSSTHRYILGLQSLNGHATDWIDLAESYSRISGNKPEVTLNFFNNPRWDGKNILETPGRFDWIMLKHPYPKENPKLDYYGVIGNVRVEGITPSDHYGVVCDIKF
jgi:endonuclease/exonuclease/phosphatase family metal-dependent hydrolase